MLQLKLQELLWQLWLHEGAGPAFRTFLAQLPLVARPAVSQLLENNFLRQVTLPELAFMGGYSLSGLKRACQETYGVAPGQWLRERRLTQARFLLRHTAGNVAQVAEAVGYENVSHFVQAFKKQFGVTPGKAVAEPIST